MSGTIYTVLVPVKGAPDKPERYEIEVGTAPTVLRYSQDGFETTLIEMFIEVETLEKLGSIALMLKFGLKDRAAAFADEVKEI